MHCRLNTLMKRRTPRRWIATVAALALLVSQWAVITYACTLGGAPATRTDQAGFVHMKVSCPGHARNPGACLQHCHPTPPTSDHGKVPAVPPLALAAQPSMAEHALSHVAWQARAPDDARSTSPPLNTRYCRYLI